MKKYRYIFNESTYDAAFGVILTRNQMRNQAQ
jgi:hypothetical protein